MSYGKLPEVISEIHVEEGEMMFYQYLPIKLPGQMAFTIEERLRFLTLVIVDAFADFYSSVELAEAFDYYAYLTVKRMYQSSQCLFSRPGYHSDGFMTDDINYIWCDSNPTIFNYSPFNLSKDDKLSLKEMEEQADPQKIHVYPANTLLKLDQYCIHKVDENPSISLRTFVKVSFSKDKYDLKGNSHNYLLKYDWEMRGRFDERNIPQKL